MIWESPYIIRLNFQSPYRRTNIHFGERVINLKLDSAYRLLYTAPDQTLNVNYTVDVQLHGQWSPWQQKYNICATLYLRHAPPS